MRFLTSLGALERVFSEAAAAQPVMNAAVVSAAADLVKKKVDEVYGTAKLADLAEATQDERSALGYAPNEPLLRDGTLLRDSVHIEHPTPDSALIGSSEPIHLYHEYGYWNDRAGGPVPARPVFKIAAADSIPEVEGLSRQTVALLLGVEF